MQNKIHLRCIIHLKRIMCQDKYEKYKSGTICLRPITHYLFYALTGCIKQGQNSSQINNASDPYFLHLC